MKHIFTGALVITASLGLVSAVLAKGGNSGGSTNRTGGSSMSTKPMGSVVNKGVSIQSSNIRKPQVSSSNNHVQFRNHQGQSPSISMKSHQSHNNFKMVGKDVAYKNKGHDQRLTPKTFDNHYHLKCGTKSSYGYCYKGYDHCHWSSRCWFPSLGCYCNYCPSTCEYYYYCEPQCCWYPVTYCQPQQVCVEPCPPVCVEPCPPVCVEPCPPVCVEPCPPVCPQPVPQPYCPPCVTVCKPVVKTYCVPTTTYCAPRYCAPSVPACNYKVGCYKGSPSYGSFKGTTIRR